MPEIKFQSDWLKANDNVKAGDRIKFLDAGAPDKDGQWVFKVAILRNGVEIAQKKFSLNKKNFAAISAAYGTNSDEWVGREMEVRIVDVDSPKGIVPAVRLTVPGGATGAAGDEGEEEELGF